MDQEKFGKLIKELRQKNHLTQKDFADKYNVTYQAVSKWENAKNMPDKALIKQISKDFNISLDDLFEGEYSTQKRKRMNLYVLGITFLGILLIIGSIFFSIYSNKDFEFKTIKSNCSDFKISGSISYNDLKSSIYISHVSYCGEKDSEPYHTINCTLYEHTKDSNKVIDTCNYEKKKEITLEEFLNQVSFTIENYQKLCKNYSKDSLYLEIEAIDAKDKITSYKIPLELESNCTK